MRILVVDDDPEIVLMLDRFLTAEGHAVTSSRRGAEALSAGLQADYDLLVCDLMLPDLQGIEVVRALKSQAPSLPVIVVSALDPADWRQPCEDAGATGFLQKPLRLQELRDEIRLVEQGRANLWVALIDPDPIHRVRITRALAGLGCTVDAYASVTDALRQLDERAAQPGLFLIDARDQDALTAFGWAKARQIASFAFGSVSAEEEERFMRAGAALIMPKPVDCDALLIQARFLTQL